MSTLTAMRPAAAVTAPVERRRTGSLFKVLDSVWFPWVWMAAWAIAQAGQALMSWHFVATGAALLTSAQWVSMGVVLGLYTVRFMGPLTPTHEVLGWLRAATLLGVLLVALGPGRRQFPAQLQGPRRLSAADPRSMAHESAHTLVA